MGPGMSSEGSNPLGLGSNQHSYNLGGPSQYGATGYSGVGGVSAQEDLKQAGYGFQAQGDRHNTISHNDHDPSMTQFSSGFGAKNPLSRRTNGQGGFLNQTADHGARNMGSTAYTKKDVAEARDGLKLLKGRMGGGNTGARRSINNASSHSENRQKDANMNQSYTNSEKGPASRRS